MEGKESAALKGKGRVPAFYAKNTRVVPKEMSEGSTRAKKSLESAYRAQAARKMIGSDAPEGDSDDGA